MTGGIAEEIVKDKINPALLEMHSAFAGAVFIISFCFFAAHVVRISMANGFGERLAQKGLLFARIWKWKQACAYVILDTVASKVLALLGTVTLIITGALGSAIVYGPDIDPAVTLIYHLFF